MANWKIVVVIIAVLMIMLVFVATQPSFSQFFGKVTGEVTASGSHEAGKVMFSVTLPGHYAIDSKISEGTITAEVQAMNALYGTGIVTANGRVAIKGFSGSIITEGNMLKLNGTALSLSSDAIEINDKQRFEASFEFSSASAGNVSISSIETESLKSVTVNRVSLTPDGKKVVIEGINAEVKYSGDETIIKGNAKSFKIPDAGISI